MRKNITRCSNTILVNNIKINALLKWKYDTVPFVNFTTMNDSGRGGTMSTVVKSRVDLTAMVCLLMVLIAGCGGGGGDSAKSGGVVDPAPSYKGATTQATPTPANAEDLALGAFGGGSIATVIGSVSKSAGSSAPAIVKNRPVLQLVQALKQSTRRMDLPAKAEIIRRPAQSAGVSKTLAKTTGRAGNYQIQGDNGGTASYTLEINDATGTFFGTVVYQGFTSQGITIDGTTEALGTFDANRQQISRLTLSFRTLNLQSGASMFSLTGTLSWVFNLASSSENLSMNMVLLDQASAKTYWFNNYELFTVYSGNGLSQTITGRYYDHDNGYVTLSTNTTLIAANGNQWPSQGTINFSGKLGSWVRLKFLANTLVVEADTDGNGSVDWQIERPTNVQPPINLPPMADAGPDQSINQWTAVRLDGSASSDPNGDPLTYNWSVVSSPGYNYTALTGANTATPSFNADSPGTYVLSLTVYDGYSASQPDTVTVVVKATTPSDPAFVAQKWQYGIYGSSIGQAGLFTTDLDGDGKPEVIASASAGGFGDNVQWYVVRKDANGGYEQVWRSPIYGVTIVRLLLADMNGDGKSDVVVALSDGTIRIYDGPTLKEIRTLTLAAPLGDVAVADLDGDGAKEIVTTDGSGVFVYDAGSGQLKWHVSSGGGSSIAVGNVDTDPALEIVTTSYGGKGYVLNGLTGSVKWEYINSFGAKVRLGDLDGDGMQEIIGMSSWYKITIFDADLKSPAWEIATSLDIGTAEVIDTDGDGIPEIVYGDGQWGKVHAVDVRTHSEKWAVNNPEHGVSGIALGDVDQDGSKELLWGAGGTSSGPDHLYIANPLTGAIRWQSLDFSGLSTLAVGDVDNDGQDEIVMVTSSSNSGYDEGIIHIFDARTHALKFRQKLGIRDWTGGNRVVRIGDVDGDGRTEFVVTTSNLYDGVVQVYDGATCTLKRQSAGYSGNYFSAVAVGDVDNDGKSEIVAGQGREHTGADGVHLVVFDGDTLQEKWRSVDLGVYWGSAYDIKLADLDKDGHPDIIATLTGSRLIVFDGVTHTLKLMIESPARAIEVADVDGDGFPEILVGCNDGKIDVYDGVTFAIKKTVFTFGTGSIDALKVVDLDGDGTKEWLIASNGVLSILDGQGLGLKWRSNNLGSNLGKSNSLAVKDTDGNGRLDIFIGTDPVLYQFE